LIPAGLPLAPLAAVIRYYEENEETENMDDLESEEIPRYVIGIDLGTTNSAVAYVRLAEEGVVRDDRKVRFLEIPQLVAQGEMARRSLLPSFLYIPGPY
jgi:hypothetical protein